MLLHLSLLPIWLFIVAIIVIFWRIRISRYQGRAPRQLLKVLFMLSLLGGIYSEYSRLSIEPMIVLLLCALSLKLLEVEQRRDVLLIIFLSYFVIACSFLFDQSVIHTVLSIIALIISTAALVQLHVKSTSLTLSVFRLPLIMITQSVVLMIVMLLLLPRLPPLWSVPIQSGQAITGVSDRMSPGDFDQLIRSQALALRVTFPDGPLAQQLTQQDMYWRGLVLDSFDGREWQRAQSIQQTVAQLRNQQRVSRAHNHKIETAVNYEVLMEPTSQRWLFGIPRFTVEESPSVTSYTPQGEVFVFEPVHQRIKYRGYSTLIRTMNPATGKLSSQKTLAHKNDWVLSTSERHAYTALPNNANPQAGEQARLWREQAATDVDYIQRVLTFYRNNFTYTLSPPKLGKHSVDEFLFLTQEGFCEHFASSFTVLMRSVGIPARVVVGYQGGTWSENKEYLSIHQRDAHAWTEVWLESTDGNEAGWVRVDPTAAVAAIRIEQGVEAAIPLSDRQQLSIPYKNSQWLASVYRQWQSIDYRWQNWVLSYDEKQQQYLLQKYLGQLTPVKLILALLIPLALVALILSAGLLRQFFTFVPADIRLFRQLQKKLYKRGVTYQPGETVSQLCDRASREFPQLSQPLSTIKHAFNEVLYARAALATQDANEKDDIYYRDIKTALKSLDKALD